MFEIFLYIEHDHAMLTWHNAREFYSGNSVRIYDVWCKTSLNIKRVAFKNWPKFQNYVNLNVTCTTSYLNIGVVKKVKNFIKRS